MRHGQTLRNSAKAFFAFAVLAMLGACADHDAVAPTAEAPAFVAPANYMKVGDVMTFRVSNSEGITKRIGDHLLSMPAGSICSLKSGYGRTEWDKPCEPLKGSIVITAALLQDADGQPYVDFQPAMRFAPNKEVILFFRQGKNTQKKQLLVDYCNNAGVCYDESLTDPSLKPFRIGNTPIVARRMKHFSGYMMTVGEYCAGSVRDNGDGTYWCEDGGLARRSGYMVASGEDVADVMSDKDKKKDE